MRPSSSRYATPEAAALGRARAAQYQAARRARFRAAAGLPPARAYRKRAERPYMPDHQECRACGVPKRLEDFGVDKSRPTGRALYCRPCAAEKAKNYYRANKERIRDIRRHGSEAIRARDAAERRAGL